MQTHGGVPAENAILASTRHMFATLRVDWNRNGLYDHALSDMSSYVSSASTDQTLSGSAPEELFLISGSSAAELSFTVGGFYNGDSLVKVFSLFNARSPFYAIDVVGAEVTYSITVVTPFGNVEYPQFIGFIQTITPDRGLGTVEFTALDRVETMRRPITLPARYTADNGMGRVNQQSKSEAVIDSVLRLCDTSATPYRPPTNLELGLSADTLTEGCQIWVTFNGWLAPTLGLCDDPAVVSGYRDSVFTSGAYIANGIPHPNSPDPTRKPLSLRPGGVNYVSDTGITAYFAAGVGAGAWNRTHYVGFTLDTSSPGWNAVTSFAQFINVGVATTAHLQVQSNGTQLRVLVSGSNGILTSSSVTIPTTSNAARGYVIVDNSDATGCRVYLKIGANSTAGFEALGPQRTNTLGTQSYPAKMEVRHPVGLSDVSYTVMNVSGANTADQSTRLATRPSLIDVGLNVLEQIPERRGTDAWDIVSEVADAEMGSVFWDEQGRFRFLNYQTLLSKRGAPVRDFSLDDLTALSSTFDLGAIRNVWTIETTKKTASGSKRDNYIYTLSEPNLLIGAPLTTTTFRLEGSGFNNVTMGNVMIREKSVGGGAFPTWPTDSTGASIYVPSWSTDGVTSWFEDPARTNIRLTPYLDLDGTLMLDVLNPYSDYIRLATQAGEPALKLRGGVVASEGVKVTKIRETSSVASYGVRNFQINNEWVQDTFPSTAIASTLMPRNAFPQPRADAISVAGDPRIQLGDSVLIQDQDGLGSRLNAQIYGIRRTLDVDSGLTDTYTIEAQRAYGLWDDPVYGKWDETFLWSA